MLTIIDDDGYKKFKKFLLPIIQSKNVPIASAVVTARVNGEVPEYTDFIMNWDDILECESWGAEIISHSHTHLTSKYVADMTYEQIVENYQRSKDLLAEHGINSEGFVYCGASATLEKCQKACQEVFNYGISNGQNKTNYAGETNRYKIKRYTVNPDKSSDELKAMIDALLSDNTGWMVWMVHTSDAGFQQGFADILSEVIDYALESGIEIVTTQKGVESYVN